MAPSLSDRSGSSSGSQSQLASSRPSSYDIDCVDVKKDKAQFAVKSRSSLLPRIRGFLSRRKASTPSSASSSLGSPTTFDRHLETENTHFSLSSHETGGLLEGIQGALLSSEHPDSPYMQSPTS